MAANMTREELLIFRRVLQGGINFINNSAFVEGADIADPFKGLKKPNIDWALHYHSELPSPPNPRKPSLLTDQQQRDGFLYYNWLRWQGNRALAAFLGNGMKTEDGRRVVEIVRTIDRVHELIYTFNIGLIAAAARFYLKKHGYMDPRDLWTEGLERFGNILNCYDPEREKLSTYAYKSLFHLFDRLNVKLTSGAARARPFSSFESEDGQQFTAAVQSLTCGTTEVDQEAITRVIENNEADLNEAELGIIRLRYFEPSGREPTWPEIARTVGLDIDKAKRTFEGACRKLLVHFKGEQPEDSEE